MLAHWLTPAGSLAAMLTVILILAIWFDVSRRRIPNWLTAAGALGALLVRALLGSEAVWSGFLGGALGLGLGVLLFAVGAMGGGDGKLLATVGFLMGAGVFARALPLMGAAGGLLALAVTVRNGTLLPTLLRLRDLVFHLVSFGRIGERRTLAMPGAVTVPYGVAVAAGAAWGWLTWGVSL